MKKIMFSMLLILLGFILTGIMGYVFFNTVQEEGTVTVEDTGNYYENKLIASIYTKPENNMKKGLEGLYNDKAKIVGPNVIISDFSDQEMSDRDYHGMLKFDGYYTIWEYNCEKNEEIYIQYSLDIESGEPSLIYISPDNEVEIIGDKNTNGYKGKKLKVKKGNNRIKVVTKGKAEVDLLLRVDTGKINMIN